MRQIKERMGLIAGVVTLVVQPALGAGAYKDLASQIAQAARQSGVKTLAVLPFSPVDAKPSTEGQQAASQLLNYLAKSRDFVVVERAMLDKVFQEYKLMATGVIRKDDIRPVGSILAVDALVLGYIHSSWENSDVHARLINVETGKILFAGHITVPPEGPAMFSIADLWISIPDIPEFNVSAPEPDFFFPDGPGKGEGSVVCGQAAKAIDSIEESALELKARYWAAKIKEPNFSMASLSSNPGSEIRNLQQRRHFYDLLKAWYYQEPIKRLTPDELKTLHHAEKRINSITNACLR